MRWHMVTGEYPPQPGGVSDYTREVAVALADAGDDVVVWAPPCPAPSPDDRGVTVRRLPDCFGPRSLRALGTALEASAGPHRVLVQYVPHAFGWKAANLPFCLWLRSRRRDAIWVMFHEVAFPFARGQSAPRNVLAAVNRLMASIAIGAAERTFVSTPAWAGDVRRLGRPGTRVDWLPVPSGIPLVGDVAAIADVRARYGQRALVGHFGGHGGLVRPLVDACVPALIERADCDVVLIGRGGETARRDLVAAHPALAGRLYATGPLAVREASLHISACDVLVQPYPDGVSTRRTSAMAVLAHRRALVTTSGALTEPLWHEGEAVVLAPADDPERLAAAAAAIVGDAARRDAIAARGHLLYEDRFSLRHTIEVLRADA